MNLQSLRQRAILLRDLRSYFDDRGFLEVQPPCLSRDCVIDAHIDPIAIDSEAFQIGEFDLPKQFYLQTSPESAMKRMLAEGASSIYSLGPVFRAGERGDLHNVEFTMLEWYDVGATLEDGVRLLGELADSLLHRNGYDVVRYCDLFHESLKLDPLAASLDELARHCKPLEAELTRVIAGDRDAMLELLFSQRIQPGLGEERPVIVTHYPLSQAALARPAHDDPQSAARFELFASGCELANGYDELLDADELLARYRRHQQLRKAAGRPPLPIETSLWRAMKSGLPECTGVAMGVDRFMMVKHGYRTIDEVLPFTIERA